MVFVFDQCFIMQYVRCVLSKSVIILLRYRELAVCFFISCPLDCKCPVACQQGAMGWSSVCDFCMS